jgi:DNA-binding IclR family transcriptional regulator
MLARGLALLDAFNRPPAVLALGELARRCALPKPTASRLAGELVESGFLARALGGFRLGPAFDQLSRKVPETSETVALRATALPHLARLFSATGAATLFAVRLGAEITVVEVIADPRGPTLPYRPGSILRRTSALGHALSAVGPQPSRVSVRSGDLVAGLVSLAVPVFAAAPEPVAAAGLVGRFGTEQVAVMLRRIAADVGADLEREENTPLTQPVHARSPA